MAGLTGYKKGYVKCSNPQCLYMMGITKRETVSQRTCSLCGSKTNGKVYSPELVDPLTRRLKPISSWMDISKKCKSELIHSKNSPGSYMVIVFEEKQIAVFGIHKPCKGFPDGRKSLDVSSGYKIEWCPDRHCVKSFRILKEMNSENL